MRYIGNKERLVDNIYSLMVKHNISGKSFFDFFAGTANVGKYFKCKNYQVYSSDLLYLSYVLQKAYIENNNEPDFRELIKILKIREVQLFTCNLNHVILYLNSLEGKSGFIYDNYTPEGTKNLEKPRMFFTGENGQKIDAIRIQIEEWKNNNLISEIEYYILLACLIESVGFFANITGVYSAFHKSWDSRALKPFKLKPIQFYDNGLDNKVYNCDSMELINYIKTDVIYIDPPYNARQYAPNYHLLETIARYDNPQINGISGMRNYETLKSDFCNKSKALENLDNIARICDYKYLILSYNSEGIMKKDDIINILSKYGKVVLETMEYARFKSNSNGLSKIKKNIDEYLFILRK